MRSLSTVLFAAGLLITTAGCGGGDSGGTESEAEGEAEAEGDDECPKEGCTTDIVCADTTDCPSNDPCRQYSCNAGSATCRYHLLDSDGDGYAPAICEGRDCNDDDRDAYPGAPERCNGQDDDCDGEGDGSLTQECGPPTCMPGARSCEVGMWAMCIGPDGPLPPCDLTGTWRLYTPSCAPYIVTFTQMCGSLAFTGEAVGEEGEVGSCTGEWDGEGCYDCVSFDCNFLSRCGLGGGGSASTKSSDDCSEFFFAGVAGFYLERVE